MTISTMPAGDNTALQQFILDNIPMARAMQLCTYGFDGDSIEIRAPLAVNVNDKGCAFAGSLSGLMTLAGWSLLEMNLQRHDIVADIYVANAEIRYLAPVTTDIHVRAYLSGDTPWQDFLTTYARRGKARAGIVCTVPGHNGDACIQKARFVAKRRV